MQSTVLLISPEEVPTKALKVPFSATQACCSGLKKDRSCLVMWKVIVLVSPAFKNTFSKPLSSLYGRNTEASSSCK